MAKSKYPLVQVLEVKERRVSEAEKVVLQKKQTLEKENEKLKECERERDKVLNHKSDKLRQLREEFDHGTTSPKVQQMKAYIEVVKDKLIIEEKKVEDQKKQVKLAEKALQEAKDDLQKKRNEVEKIETHRKDWQKEMKKENERIEGREMDELGSQIFMTNRARYKSK